MTKSIFLAIMIGILPFFLTCQNVSTFENLLLLPDTFWNGSDLSGGFTSGNAYFPNKYDTSFGGSWSGFAYSDIKDNSTFGYTNQYSAITGGGINNSANYAVFYFSQFNRPSRLKLLSRDSIRGFYITNSTWAALSMQYGDAFSKKFGGIAGNDPDWFKLSVKGYNNGNPVNKMVEFYLADFRFINNSQDYIISSWTWLNLDSLGLVDSIEFKLSSSDTGIYGINTPAYFCLDNFTSNTGNSSISYIREELIDLEIFPNPFNDNIYIQTKRELNKKLYVEIVDYSGRVLFSDHRKIISNIMLDLEFIEKGSYIIKIIFENKCFYRKIIKL